MAKFESIKTIEAIMSAVEDADMGLVFFVQDGLIVLYDGQVVSSGDEEFESWFFSKTERPSMENAPDGVLSVIGYEE